MGANDYILLNPGFSVSHPGLERLFDVLHDINDAYRSGQAAPALRELLDEFMLNVRVVMDKGSRFGFLGLGAGTTAVVVTTSQMEVGAVLGAGLSGGGAILVGIASAAGIVVGGGIGCGINEFILGRPCLGWTDISRETTYDMDSLEEAQNEYQVCNPFNGGTLCTNPGAEGLKISFD